MSYASELAAFSRVPQWIVELYMTHCDNHYTVNTKPNLLLRSEEIDNAAWINIGTPIVTANAAADPLGAMTAEKIEDNDVAAREGRRQTIAVAPASKTFTFSVWLRADAPMIASIAITDLVAQRKEVQIKIGTRWERHSVTQVFSASGAANTAIDIIPDDGFNATVGICYAWGAQLTETAFPLSYQKTVASTVQTSICTATDQGDGSRCAYSFPTCQDVPNFKTSQSGIDPGLRVFRFCLKDAPIPVDGEGILPLLKEPVFIPQKIDPKRAIVSNERVVLTFYDEAMTGNFDADKLPGLTNTSMLGTFWRRFREIYRNYTERRIVVRPCFAAAGLTMADIAAITPDFDGLISNIEIDEDGLCIINAVDKLKRARRKIPAKISDTNTVRTTLVSGVTLLDVVDAGEFTDPSKLSPSAEVFVEIGYENTKDLTGTLVFTNGSAEVTGFGTRFLSEIVFPEMIWADSDDEVHAVQVESIATDTGLTLQRAYTGRGGQARGRWKRSDFSKVTAVDLINNRLTLVRDKWATASGRSLTHLAGQKIREVVWLGTDIKTGTPANDRIDPEQSLDAVIRILRLAGIPEVDIDVTTIQSQRDLWHSGSGAVKVLQFIKDSIEVNRLISSLEEVGVFSVFINESAKVTAKVYSPPLPTDIPITYNESEHFVAGSQSVDDDDEEARLTRVTCAWDPMGDLSGDEPGQYHRVLTRLNASSESSTGYGDRKEKTILSKALFRDQTNAAVAAVGRTLARFLAGAKTLNFSLELKDAGLKLGDFFIVNTSRIQTIIGANASKTFQVIRKKRSGLGKWDFEALEAFGQHRTAFIGPNSLPSDYDSATVAQRKYAFIGDGSNKVGNSKDDGYYIW